MITVFADKICDQISDAVLDAHLKQDPDAKVACGKICCQKWEADYVNELRTVTIVLFLNYIETVWNVHWKVWNDMHNYQVV